MQTKSLAAQRGFSEGMGSADKSETVTVISVCVHVMSNKNGTVGYVPRIQIVHQIEQLNHDFAGRNAGLGTDTRFTFKLSNITRHYNNKWHNLTSGSAAERAAKTATHVGGPNVLNLWLAYPYTFNPRTGKNEELLGYATFPSEYKNNPAMDGVVVNYKSLPGGSLVSFNLGRTATHEVGHWLGLFHIFGNTQRACSGKGDGVRDTVYQRLHFECTVGKDSCPNRDGVDMIHNFMGYADDCCMLDFTEGQAQRMREMWQAHRSS